MNQILFVGAKESKTDISKIVKVFGVLILIFGIAIAAIGGVNFAKKFFAGSGETSGTEAQSPVIDLTKTGDYVRIRVSHPANIAIDKVQYSWNGESTIQFSGNGKAYIEEVIDLLQGENILEVRVTDINGKEAKVTKEFSMVEGQDNAKPQIIIEELVGYVGIKITVTDNIALNSVQYKWNDEEFTDIPLSEDDVRKVEKTLEIPMGNNKLTVVAVDINNNEFTLEKEIITTSKPKVELEQSDSILILKATDEKQMKSVTYHLNGEIFYLELEEGYVTDAIEYAINLEPGENTIIIEAYNIDGAVETKEGTYTVEE